MVSTRRKVKEEKEKYEASTWGVYDTLRKSHPRAMNSLEGAVITAVSVLASQYIKSVTTGKPFDLDTQEIMVMTTVSITLITPTLLSFYGFLGEMKFNKLLTLFIDQVVFSPIFTTMILSYISILKVILTKGEIVPFHELTAVVQGMLPALPGIITKGWCFWVPVRLGVIYMAPEAYHILIGNVCSFVWNIIFMLLLA